MILAFDDYFCWSPERISGEQSVLLEFAREFNTKYKSLPVAATQGE
jgi:hypothetical protein